MKAFVDKKLTTDIIFYTSDFLSSNLVGHFKDTPVSLLIKWAFSPFESKPTKQNNFSV